jgi:pterin-4a-carbinolamine dehydratase
LAKLNEEFIKRSQATTVPLGRPPLTPKENPANIAVMSDKWLRNRSDDGGHCLSKSYRFREIFQRNAFVKGLMSYEEHTSHQATVTLEGDTVSIVVWTKNIDTVTELDYEYAHFADNHFKSCVIISSNEED